MGIRDKRFNRAVNRILREELQKGNLPSSKEFSYRLNQYLNEHNLSAPEYSFKPVRSQGTVSSYEYNKSMNNVSTDLNTLYENAIDIHNLLSKNFSKFEVDKSKLEYEINVLENRLKDLILLYSKNGFLATAYDVFDDTSKVDPKSTAHVDIKTHEVSIPEIKNTSRKINPNTSASFAILPEIAKDVQALPVSGTPSSSLNDAINSTWQQVVYTDMKEQVAGYYFVDFKEKQTLNRITISLLTVKPTLVRIEFSPDGLNWFNLPYHEQGRTIASDYTFDFPTLEMEKFRILLSKSEPDDESSSNQFVDSAAGNKYKYIFGIKRLGMYQLDYPPTASFQSTALKVNVPSNQNFSINEVSLSVEEVLPSATDIKYWIAIPPADTEAEPEWKPISPVERSNPQYDQVIDFRNISGAPATIFSIDSSKSLSEYEMESYAANGITFYKIGEVDNKQIVNGTERLYAGKDTWGAKRFAYQWADHTTHLPSMNDWAKPQDYTYEYYAMEDGKPGEILEKEGANDQAWNYMFTVGVLSGKGQTVEAAIPSSTEPIAIYVNGTMVFQGIPDGNSKVPYKFDYGWNEIVVLLYVRNIGAANKISLNLGIDVRKYGSNVYSQAKPMELVSLHDLRYNVKSNDRNKYALDVVNDKSYVILNHAVYDLEYDFYYNYVEGDVKDTILFKAELSKSDQHSAISPKLKSYRLRFS